MHNIYNKLPFVFPTSSNIIVYKRNFSAFAQQFDSHTFLYILAFNLKKGLIISPVTKSNIILITCLQLLYKLKSQVKLDHSKTILQSETCLNRTLYQLNFKNPSVGNLCLFNLCKPNTPKEVQLRQVCPKEVHLRQV